MSAGRFLVAINVLFYLYNLKVNGEAAVTGLTGEQALKVGGMNGRDAQATELFTAMFAHASLSHIALNMLLLVMVASLLQQAYSGFAVLAGYIATGLLSNVTSSIVLPDTISLGASGAIFGLLGMAIVGATFNRTMRHNWLTLVLITAGNAVFGLMSENVNNVVHFSGLMFGMLIMLPAAAVHVIQGIITFIGRRRRR